jgi:hypothetical protein
MGYASKNFKSKKAFKEAIAAGEKISVRHGIFLSLDSAVEKLNGKLLVEGPWNPVPHSWAASAVLVDGYVEKVA